MNEGCFTKGLALMKYAMMGTLGYSLMHLKAYPPNNLPYSWGMRAILRRYASHLPIPCTLSFVYGVSLCTSATIREKDDTFNYLPASVVLGLTLSTIKDNFAAGFILAIVTLAGGIIFQRARYGVRGIQLGHVHQNSNVVSHSGPLTWKYFNMGDAPLPTKTW